VTHLWINCTCLGQTDEVAVNLGMVMPWTCEDMLINVRLFGRLTGPGDRYHGSQTRTASSSAED
jgi:hypothetical protein